MSVTHFTEERCVMCGEVIEEGRQVCWKCDKAVFGAKPQPQESTNRLKRHSCIFARLLNRKGD